MTADEFTNQELFLEVGDGHQIYVQDWGNSKAKTPIVFLHGGPGAGCNDSHKQVFDPVIHRVIFFDQRGCGKSRPLGSISHNQTNHLLDDIDKIRHKLNLEKVILFGRSWDSTLALAYAINNPQSVAAIFTGGIYLASAEENTNELAGAKNFYPELYDQFMAATPAIKPAKAVDYHLKNILGNDEAKAKKSAYEYSRFTVGSMRLDDRQRPVDYETFEWQSFKIEAHYKLNNCFLEDGFILNSAGKITAPAYIVQGRYDITCLPKVAYELDSKLTNSQLIWTIAGHSSSDRANYDATKALLLSVESNA